MNSSDKQPFGVVLFLMNEKGRVLTITRKGNENSFGLVGGKIDATDKSARHALDREVFEETGIDISQIPHQLSFNLLDDSNAEKPVYIEGFVLVDGAESLFPNTRQLTPEGTFMEFKEIHYIMNSEHCLFWKYNFELYQELRATLGV
jgi:8-oxo-dGTP pyrophosphatase MutT (NUDIX family)